MGEEQRECEPTSAIRRRTLILSVFFALWAMAAMCRAWYIAVPGRQRFITAGEQAARRTYAIPAQRGRILDREGVCLVWSERSYDLVSTCPDGDALSDGEMRMLATAVSGVTAESGVLRRGLSPEELLALEAPIKTGVRARIVPRDERIVVDSPVVRKLVGELSRKDGDIHGVSGWEFEYDAELSGTPGEFTVMLDRRRNWIASSLKIVKLPVAGRDVRLSLELEKIEASGRKE